MGYTNEFNDIYKQYYDRSFKFTMLYVHDNAAAEDIVIESLVKLWKVMKKEEVKNLPALLLTILKHKSLDFLKAQANQQESLDAMPVWRQEELQIRISTLEACNPNYIFSKEIQILVENTLNSLHPKTSRAFLMSRKENKSVKEIAQIMGISVKGVDYHISKALKALRIVLKDYLPLYILWVINSKF